EGERGGVDLRLPQGGTGVLVDAEHVRWNRVGLAQRRPQELAALIAQDERVPGDGRCGPGKVSGDARVERHGLLPDDRTGVLTDLVEEPGRIREVQEVAVDGRIRGDVTIGRDAPLQPQSGGGLRADLVLAGLIARVLEVEPCTRPAPLCPCLACDAADQQGRRRQVPYLPISHQFYPFLPPVAGQEARSASQPSRKRRLRRDVESPARARIQLKNSAKLDHTVISRCWQRQRVSRWH